MSTFHPLDAPNGSVPAPEQVIATIRNAEDLVEAFRTMQGILGMTNAQVDDLANLTDGHTDKLLGPSRQKGISPLTFNALAWTFAVKFEMKIDVEQAKVMAEHWDDRKRTRPAEFSENGRVSKKLLKAAQPLVFKANGKIGGMVRCHMLTPKHRSDIARKAAKARWKKHRASLRAARRAISVPVEPADSASL